MTKAMWVLIVVVALAGCGKNGEPAEAPVTLEHKLATVAAGHPVESSDTSVERARLLLDRVSEKYEMPPEQLADQASMLGNLLKTKGVQYNLLDIMDAALIATSTDPRFVRSSFSEFGATYITIRSGDLDMNHWMTVRSIVGIQNAMMVMSQR